MDRRLVLAAGIAVTLAATGLWHGLGAADRFSGTIERSARLTLDQYEMTSVQAAIERGPLTRRLLLSGPADDFQRGELIRIMGQIPGVGDARWSRAGRGVPLIAEAVLLSLIGFGLGLLLAYLVEARRRANAHWRW